MWAHINVVFNVPMQLLNTCKHEIIKQPSKDLYSPFMNIFKQIVLISCNFSPLKFYVTAKR